MRVVKIKRSWADDFDVEPTVKLKRLKADRTIFRQYSDYCTICKALTGIHDKNSN